MLHLENLNELEKDTLLRFVFYYMEPPLRRKIMEVQPVLYNRAVGREVVTVKVPDPGSVWMQVTFEEASS